MNALLLAAILAAAPVRAEEAATPAKSVWGEVSKWLKELKSSLSDSAVRKQHRQVKSAIAVAAVRGAEQTLEDPDKPYWKGTAASKQEREERQERAELAAAVELAMNGDAAGSLKALDAFESAHPSSGLLGDLRQTREKIKAASPEQTAEVKPAETKSAEAKPAEAKPAEETTSAVPGASAPKTEAPKSDPVKADEEKH
ncbi:MAG: hypothetical protein HY925_16340 [Elusimicrobia bacterium]|nr:hypothetical protein [Elusimicrobiota bacterium]